MDTVHECDRQTDRQTDGQNYDHKNHATQRRTVKTYTVIIIIRPNPHRLYAQNEQCVIAIKQARAVALATDPVVACGLII